MTDIAIGVHIRPQHVDYADIRTTLAEAEELGADIAYNWDHFFPLYGEPDGKHFECWSMLAAWAEQTERIRIGPLVSCNSYRNADLVADMARTIAHISGGRFIFGIGAGWCERDYVEFGYEFGTFSTRFVDLEANLPRFRDRWTRGNPEPVGDVPVLIGGIGERKTLRLVARYADVWHAMFPDRAEELMPKVDALHRWCAEISRDPAEVELAVGVNDPATFLESETEQCLELGFTQFTLVLDGPAFDLGPVKDWLAWRDDRSG